MVMEGGDKKLYMGQHKNETYSEVAKRVEFIKWPVAEWSVHAGPGLPHLVK